jgi:dienelactone hydrolase
MLVQWSTSICAILLASSVSFAQSATPAAAAKLDANSPAQAGRQALYTYLDDIAAKDEAARRAEIAKIATRAQAEARQQEVRARILDLLGGGFVRTPLNAKVTGSTAMEGFRIEKVVYESQPGFYVTALLYVPEGGVVRSTLSVDRSGTKNVERSTENAKYPAVVMAPGHAASGKAGDYAMAATFARNGFVVLSYDPLGQGERLQYPDPAKASAMLRGNPYPGVTLANGPTGEHGEAGLQPTLIGDAVARYFLWDGMRAVDYLVSRPEVDAEKIGAFGCSGGGAMTALLGAADKRVKAVATACYLTTMDALLPSLGPQDAEQSVPGFIANGLDFADWVELAAPRAYAMVGTVGDMFPWKGFLETAQEARRFYSLFDGRAEGSSQLSVLSAQEKLPMPTGPVTNPDTASVVSTEAPFQVITGIGGHGNLKPLTAQIVGFFLVHLAGRGAGEFVADEPTSQTRDVGHPAPDVPAGALQVTATGQVATSYPGSETVFSLNLKRAKEKLPQLPVQTLLQVQTDVREVTEAEAVPISSAGEFSTTGVTANQRYSRLIGPRTSGRHPAILMLTGEPLSTLASDTPSPNISRFEGLASTDVVLAFEPRPSPPGAEETKAAILGPFYLTELRAELVGKTLLGMRVDDVIRAVDYLAARPDVDAKNITVVASGHMGLVALHAAVLDSRIKHVTVDHVLKSYRSLLEAPMPVDAPQDILPGVLKKYDVPDLVRVLGDRVTATDWLAGTADLSGR